MKVIIAAGGTAGHINPGLAIAQYIKSKHPEAEIMFVGRKSGMEYGLRILPHGGNRFSTQDNPSKYRQEYPYGEKSFDGRGKIQKDFKRL